MSEKRIVLSHSSYAVLKGLVDSLRRSGKMKLPHFSRFAQELRSAVIMDAGAIPDNVITMHSRVRYTYLNSGTSSEAVIVFPVETKSSPDHVSILSPLGLALIGEQQGTEIEYEAPGGIYRLRIESVEHLHSVSSDVNRS